MSEFLDLLRRVATLERRLADMVVEGVVHQVQAKPYRVKVNFGTGDEPQLSNWLAVGAERAATGNSWWPLEVGEAVTIISPGGKLERGRVLRGRYSEEHPPASTDLNLVKFEFGDGGYFQYSRSTGEGVFKAMTKLTLDTEVKITKNLQVVGTSKAADHLSGADEISGKGHIHTGDRGGDTSKPKK